VHGVDVGVTRHVDACCQGLSLGRARCVQHIATSAHRQMCAAASLPFTPLHSRLLPHSCLPVAGCDGVYEVASLGAGDTQGAAARDGVTRAQERAAAEET
jgi:hypothetical protein